jgi:ABC-type amino acid transport system permease subunit
MFENFFERFWRILHDYKDLLLKGLGLSLNVMFWAFLIGLLVSAVFVLQLSRRHPNRFNKCVNGTIHGTIWILRGIPIPVLLLLSYYVIFGAIDLSALMVAIVVFGLCAAAHLTGTIYGAVRGIHKGQYEAAVALGFSYGFTMRKIIFPQAYRNAFPAIGNELIILLKHTAILSFLSLHDLTGMTQIIINNTYDVVVAYIVLAIIYLIIVGILSFFIRLIERKVFTYAR